MRSIKLDLTKIRGLTGKCVVATSDADISAGLTVTIGSQGSKCCVAPAVLNLIESGCRGWNAECGKTKMILRTGIEPVTLRCTRGIQLQSHALPTELSKAIYQKHYNVYNNNLRTDDIMIMIGATEALKYLATCHTCIQPEMLSLCFILISRLVPCCVWICL